MQLPHSTLQTALAQAERFGAPRLVGLSQLAGGRVLAAQSRPGGCAGRARYGAGHAGAPAGLPFEHALAMLAAAALLEQQPDTTSQANQLRTRAQGALGDLGVAPARWLPHDV